MYPSFLLSGRFLVELYLAYTLAFYSRAGLIKVNQAAAVRREILGEKDPLFEYRGLIHLHSQYSADANGSYDELSRAARRHRLDFLVATDHNNADAIADGQQGWRNGSLVLTGVEIKRPEGYLLLLGIEEYVHNKLECTSDLLKEHAEKGGFGLVVHAGNCRRPWKGELDCRITGLEILDFADQLYDCSAFAKLNAFLFYPANWMLACLRVYHRPAETLARWDREASRRPVVGFYGPNMHQKVKILRWRPKFPPADVVMALASNHILSKESLTGSFPSDRRLVYRAIRNGNLFFALDFLGDSSGFRFSASQGRRNAIMGETLGTDAETVFSVTLPEIQGRLQTEIVVYLNGAVFIRERKRKLTFRAIDEGAYRVEVLTRMPTFLGRGRMAPWIYSNPIYLKAGFPVGIAG